MYCGDSHRKAGLQPLFSIWLWIVQFDSDLMRKREREKVIGKLEGYLDEEHGRPLCVRPYRSDEKMLDEIARETGEKRSALVRRMIRFALSDRHERFGANRCRDRLDLLIDQGRRRTVDSERLDEIFERVARLEDRHGANSRQTSIFLSELYSLTSLSVMVMNILLTKLMEVTAPQGTSHEKIVLVADGTMANLIAKSVADFEKCLAHHGIASEREDSNSLYLATRIKGLTMNRSAKPKPDNDSR